MNNIPSILLRWEFDPVGSSPDNLIRKEEHRLSVADKTSMLVSPQYGPFYSARLFDKFGNVIDKKYYTYGDAIPELLGVVENQLYHNIILNNITEDSVFIDYQTVGGEYVRISHEFLSYLVSALNEAITTNFDNVMNVPHKVPVYQHRHHWIDIKNTELIRNTIDALRRNVEVYGDGDISEQLDLLSARIETIANTLIRYRLDEHTNLAIVDGRVAHQLTAADIGSEVKNSSAANADMFYGITYIKYLEEQYAESLNWDKLKDYLKVKAVHTIEDDLIVNGKINWGGIVKDNMTSDGLFRLGSSKSIKFGSDGAYLNLTNTTIDFNGYKIYDWLSALEYSSAVEGSYSVSIRSDYFTITGLGTVAKPLLLDVKLNPSTEHDNGFVQVAREADDRSDGWGFSSGSAYGILDSIQNHLLRTVTINGHVIDNDVTITAADIELGKVDNTSDKAKPVTDAELVELDKLSDLDHRHSWVDLGIPTSNIGVLGVDTIANTLEGKGAVTQKLANEFSGRVELVSGVIDAKADCSEFKFRSAEFVRAHANVNAVSVVSAIVTFKLNDLEVVYNISNITADHVSTHDTVGIYIIPMDEFNSLVVGVNPGTPPPEDAALIAMVKVGAPLDSLNTTSVLDHKADTRLAIHKDDLDNPHKLIKPMAELSEVVNYDVVRSLSKGTTLLESQADSYGISSQVINNKATLSIITKTDGASPLKWRSKLNNDNIHQSSFVVVSDIADLHTRDKSVTLGVYFTDTEMRELYFTVSPTGDILFYTSTKQIIKTHDSVSVISVERTLLTHKLDAPVVITHDSYAPADKLFYRTWFNEKTQQFKVEVCGSSIFNISGTIVALDSDGIDNINRIINSGYVGFSTASSKLSVIGHIREPNPFSKMIVNDYKSLLRAYVTPYAMEELKEYSRDSIRNIEARGYYSAETDTIVFDDLHLHLPSRYTNLSVDFVSMVKSNGELATRLLSELDVSQKLSSGTVTKVFDWWNGFTAPVMYTGSRSIALNRLKAYNGAIIESKYSDNEQFLVRFQVRCSYTMWGVSSCDWNYLSFMLATEDVGPDPDVTFVLDGLESKLLN